MAESDPDLSIISKYLFEADPKHQVLANNVRYGLVIHPLVYHPKGKTWVMPPPTSDIIEPTF